MLPPDRISSTVIVVVVVVLVAINALPIDVVVDKEEQQPKLDENGGRGPSCYANVIFGLSQN